MTALYGRKWSLLIGNDTEALDLSQLRFTFEVHRGDQQTPNYASIRVFNVAPKTAQRIASVATADAGAFDQTGFAGTGIAGGPLVQNPVPEYEFKRVVLQAGYETGNYGKIFDGTTTYVRSGRLNATDTYLHIIAQDSDFAYNFANVQATLAAGTSIGQCANAVIGSMAPFGVSAGYLPEFPDVKLPRGKVMYGASRDYMRSICAGISATWSLQDNELSVLPLTGYLPGQAIVLTSATGMIGIPEQTQQGIRVRSLLNPNIKIGGVLQINNKSIQGFQLQTPGRTDVQTLNAVLNSVHIDADGFYRPLICDYFGDTRGEDWYCDIVALSYNATFANKQTTLANRNAFDYAYNPLNYSSDNNGPVQRNG